MKAWIDHLLWKFSRAYRRKCLRKVLVHVPEVSR